MRLKLPASLLIILFLAAVFVIVIAYLDWSTAVGQSNVPTPGSTQQSSESVELLKEKLDNYSKRADDLQKLISLLLGLSSVYAVVLGASAYTIVQNNIQQADKSIAKLEELLEKLPKEFQELQEKTTYSTHVTMASGSLALALQSKYLSDAHIAIGTLLDLRSGKHSTDRYVNFLLGRLYKALNRPQNAEEVMTSLIARKETLGEMDDAVIADAYYNRACYRSMRWPIADTKEKTRLEKEIRSDLIRTFRLDETYKKDAQKDDDFTAVKAEPWFRGLF